MIGARGQYRPCEKYRLQVVGVEDETSVTPCLLLDSVDDLKKGYFGRYGTPLLSRLRIHLVLSSGAVYD